MAINKEYNDVQLDVNFTQASTRANLVSEENISVSFGKLAKWYAALVPSGGSSGKILAWNSSGTAKWSDPLHPTITKSADTTSTASPAHGGTFTTVDSVTRDANGHVTKINTKTVALPSDQNTDTLMTQTNTTGSADYRVLLSGNANDTTETTTGRKSTNLKFNPSSGGLYSFGFLWTDITGQTLDINTLTLSDGTLHSRRFIEKTDGGASNITNTPVAGKPFLLEVDLIRWGSTTDYITRQRFTNAANGTYSYVRYCTNGTWGSWTTRKYTDTDTKVTSSANHYTPATASGQDKTASASGATAAWSIDVVKGVTLNTDGKGHVTGISVTSGKIPANPVPSNNVTGSGTSGYLTKWNGTNTITNGPQLGSSTTTFLRNDGTWATPTNTNTTYTLGTSGNNVTLTPSSGSVQSITVPYAANAAAATTATNANVTVTNGSTTSTDYGIVFAVHPNTTEGNTLRKTNDFRYQMKDGAANTEGFATIVLGNNKKLSEANNKSGNIYLYSSGGNWHLINTTSTTSNITHTLPATSGTILNSGTTSFTQTLSSGTKIGTIKINGTSTDLYCQTNTNTDTKVTQSETTTTNYRPIVFGATNSTDTSTLAATTTDQTYVSTLLYAQPQNGILYANRMYLKAPGSKGQLNLLTSKYNVMLRNDDSNTYFLVTAQNDPTGPWTSARPLTINNSTGVCNINGNAATATKATQDGDGNTISSTYLKLSGGTMTGTIQGTYTNTHIALAGGGIGDYATLDHKNNINISSWYGVSISNGCSRVGTLDQVTFSVNARTGATQQRGNAILYSESGNSPALIFQRGTFLDNAYDWKMYVNGGNLYFEHSITSSSSTQSWVQDMMFLANDKRLKVTSATENTTPCFFVERSDTSASVWFGIGSGGVNHGIFSGSINSWVFVATATEAQTYNIAKNPSTATTYAISFGGAGESGVGVPTNGTFTTGVKGHYINDGLGYRTREGVANGAEGLSALVLGNSLASSVAKNKTGYVRQYSTNAYYTDLKPNTLTASRTILLPDAAGTIAVFPAVRTSGQVVVTDGTAGAVKSSGYTIATSVPSGAKFTDAKVTQTAVGSTYTNYRPIVISSANSATEGFSPSTTTDGTFITSSLYCQPSSGMLHANIFEAGKPKTTDGAAKGQLKFFSGNASDATGTVTLECVNDAARTGDYTVKLPTWNGTIPVFEKLFEGASNNVSLSFSDINEYDLFLITVANSNATTEQVTVASLWISNIAGVHDMPLIWGGTPSSSGGACNVTSGWIQLTKNSGTTTFVVAHKTNVAQMTSSGWSISSPTYNLYIRKIFGLKAYKRT